jgi:hypothetical protein
MLSLEFSTTAPSDLPAYPPYRCTCTPAASCPACQPRGAQATVRRRHVVSLEALERQEPEAPPVGQRPRGRSPAEKRRRVLDAVQRWLAQAGRLPQFPDVTQQPPPGLSHSRIAEAFGNLDTLWVACVEAGLCETEALIAARVHRKARVSMARADAARRQYEVMRQRRTGHAKTRQD